MSAIYDKRGREIMQGDILKVFHYVGARNKRHYMYKQVVGERLLGQRQAAYWFVSHLEQREDSGYHLAKDGAHYRDYEIVQSIDARLEDRPRHFPAECGAHGSERSDDGTLTPDESNNHTKTLGTTPKSAAGEGIGGEG